MRLSFTPALPCVDCCELTAQGCISLMSSQVWQLLPLCSKDSGEAEPVDEENTFASIDQPQQLVTSRIRTREQLQRRRRWIARAYVRLRRQRAHVKVQRSLRRELNRVCKLQVEAMEVGR